MKTQKPQDLPDDTYNVGYGKPPAEHIYTPSTAPRRGRKPGSKNKPKHGALTVAEQEALAESKRILKKDSGLTERLAVHRAQVKSAVADGSVYAQKAYSERIDRIERKEAEAEQKALEIGEEYVRFAEMWLDRVGPHDRQRFERSLVPHPADLEVDWNKRVVRCNGPMNSLELREWNAIKEGIAWAREVVLVLRRIVELDPTNWGKQKDYIYAIGAYADAQEALPERHRLGPLPVWRARVDIPFFYNDPLYWKLRKRTPRKPRSARSAQETGARMSLDLVKRRPGRAYILAELNKEATGS